MLNRIYSILPISQEAIKNIYLFGSRVYGSAHEQSDYDFIVIGDNTKYQEVTKDDINVHIFSQHLFSENIKSYDMRALECIMAPKHAILKEELDFKFKLKPKEFRSSLFLQVDKNWRVAKKKFDKGDVSGGKKRIYHSLRLLMFGHDILKNNKITLWSAANIYHRHIQEDEHVEWDYYLSAYEIHKINLERGINKLVK